MLLFILPVGSRIFYGLVTLLDLGCKCAMTPGERAISAYITSH
jgi:hypothetical protein